MVVALIVLFAGFVKMGEAQGPSRVRWNVARVVSLLIVCGWLVLFAPRAWS